MKQDETINIIEAVLFISEGPVLLEHLRHLLNGMEENEIVSHIAELNRRLKSHPIEVVEIADGYQIRTKPEYSEWVKAFHKLERSTKLSPASLEVLSIVTYKQPITRQEIEDIRGVDSSGIVKKLLDKGLIKSMGRKILPGRPMTFGTSRKFLEYFGLARLSDVPTLKDLPEDVEAEISQKALVFEKEAVSGEKDESDIQIEKEAAFIEPVEEDHDDKEPEDEFQKNTDEEEGNTSSEDSR